MDFSKLTRLQTVEIKAPCRESWDAMAGDEQRRFCGGCGCFVHNLAELPATEAESLLSGTEKVCTRMVLDAHKGMLTRDGWVPRLLMASAVAASLAGCSTATTGETSAPNSPPPTSLKSASKSRAVEKTTVDIVVGSAAPMPPLKKSADKPK